MFSALILAVIFIINTKFILKIPKLNRDEDTKEKNTTTTKSPLYTDSIIRKYKTEGGEGVAITAGQGKKNELVISSVSNPIINSPSPNEGSGSLVEEELGELGEEGGEGGEGGKERETGGNGNGNDNSSSNNEGTSSSLVTARMTSRERFIATLHLWPYMIPLFVVYFAG